MDLLLSADASNAHLLSSTWLEVGIASMLALSVLLVVIVNTVFARRGVKAQTRALGAGIVAIFAVFIVCVGLSFASGADAERAQERMRCEIASALQERYDVVVPENSELVCALSSHVALDEDVSSPEQAEYSGKIVYYTLDVRWEADGMHAHVELYEREDASRFPGFALIG